MTFAAPLALLALVLVPLVVLLHSIAARWRVRDVSSLGFWEEALHDMRTSLRIRRLLRSLSLLAAVLVVAALAVGLARPLVGRPAVESAGDTVLVLDVSASMGSRSGGTTRYAEAKEEALRIVAGLRRGARVCVVAAGAVPRVLAPFTDDRGDLSRLIGGSSATDEPGSPIDSLLFALGLREQGQATRVVFVTDGAFSSLGDADPERTGVRLVTVGERADNVGITAMSFRRTAAGGVELFVSVAASGGAPRTVPLVVSAGGKAALRRELTLGSTGSASVSVPWEGPTAGRVTARIEVDDALAADDAAYAVFAPARTMRVLLVGRPDAFLEAALSRFPGVVLKRVDAVDPVVGARELDGYDLAVFNGGDPPPVERGNVLVFGAVPPGLPLEPKGVVAGPRFVSWDRGHPLLASLSLGPVVIERALATAAGPGVKVIARSRDAPLIATWEREGLRVLFVAFQPSQSDLPLRAAFPLFAANALSWFRPGVLGADASTRRTGETVEIGVTADVREARVTGPDGREAAWPVAAGVLSYTGTSRAGFHRVEGSQLRAGHRGQPVRCLGNRPVVSVRRARSRGRVGAGRRCHGRHGGERQRRGRRRRGPARRSRAARAGVVRLRARRAAAGGRRGTPLGGAAAPWRGSEPQSGSRERRPRGGAAAPWVAGAPHEAFPVSFASPGWLALLAIVPPLAVLLVRRSADLPRGRRASFVTLRAVSLVLLALALAGPRLSQGSDRIELLLLLDSSDSVDEAARRMALETFDSLRARLRPDDSVGIVRFGADADLERLASGSRAGSATGAASTPPGIEAGATDIEAAILYAVAQFGAGGSRRILLASDGVENRGDAAAAAAVARASGVELDVLPLESAVTGGEVLVRDVSAPAEVRAGETRDVTVIVRSRTGTRARVLLLRDGSVVAGRSPILEPGENAVRFELLFPERGLAAVTAVVEAAADRFVENNRFTRLVEVTGSPAVLAVSSGGRRSAALLSALAAQGITVVERDASGVPGTLAGFLPYDAVLLDDVPGFSFSWEKMETIERFVRDAGGGLLMIGGPHSFGAGGWFETPVERALPVDMDVTSQAELPRLALVIVTDKSGSMGGMVPSGETKLDVVKSAALSVLELLNPFDRVGLLAFDADKEWTVPLTQAQNRGEIAAELATLQPGGGTVLEPALEEAYRELAGVEAAVKHVIVLTDGLTNPGDFERLARAMRGAKITVSTVAVGDDADAPLLASIASWGGGRTYATADPGDVPRIFMTETLLASRSLLVETRFLPRAAAGQELLSGIEPSTLPPLLGFVLTYPKQGATRVLDALHDAPLLATWRYGLGRAAAFTSDLAGRWGREWVAWESFPRFVAQLVRWIEPPVTSEVLHPAVSIAGGQGAVAVDAWDALGEFVNGLEVSAVVAGPRRYRQEVALPQSGPGRYEGAFAAGETGEYVATVSARSPDVSVRTVGVSVPYPEEYLDAGADRGLLEGLAAATGGGVVDPGDSVSLDRLLRRERGAAVRQVELWPLLLALALACFFLDVAVRKLTLPEGLRERLGRLFGRTVGSRSWSYEELAAMVQKARDEERRKLRERISGMAADGKVSSELAAYLYIARMRSGKQGTGVPRPSAKPEASAEKEA